MTELLEVVKKRSRNTGADEITLSSNEKLKKLNKDASDILTMMRKWQEVNDMSSAYSESYSLAVNNFFEEMYSIKLQKVNSI